MSEQTESHVEQARKVALPSLLGVEIGHTIWPQPWRPYPFLLDAERELVAAAVDEEEQDWFILNAPNQIGKTAFAVLFIFWFIGMFPDRQVIFISYSGEYSSEQGRLVRDLFKLHGERLFGLTVDPDNDSQGDWSLKGHPAGGMLSVGWTGQITGRQGHLVWIDDLLKTIIEAASSTTKDAQWAEWKGTMWGRRQPGSTYVVSQTRLAEDDLSGRLLKQLNEEGGAIPWKHLLYPGLCWVPDDYDGDPDEYRDRLGRAPGEPLVTRFSRPGDTPEKNWWALAGEQLGSPAVFDCMVQQNPTNSQSGMFPEDRWVLEYRADWPARYVQTRAWDVASTKGSGDYTCGALASKGYDGRYYIEGRYREQVGPDEGIEAVKQRAAADGHAVIIQVEQGKSGSEKQLLEFYAQSLPGYTVIPAVTDGTKEQRATTYSVIQQQGKIVLPADEEDEEWVKQWIKEHKGMMGDGRRPRHDDEIDAGAYAIRWLAGHDAAEWSDPSDITSDVERQMELREMLEAMGL
jgi:predicted phage terminase large subunit-like protein